MAFGRFLLRRNDKVEALFFAILRCYECGRGNTYLKSWKFPYDTAKGKTPITLKHILSHTAGTSVHGFRGYAADEKLPTLLQILNGEAPANSQPIRSLFDAGTKVQYSGGGTTISQQMVMDVTGQGYDAYMQKAVLAPLGMKSSFYSYRHLQIS
jgi:CubicO group peptidase (beta-lactamase class C family)